MRLFNLSRYGRRRTYRGSRRPRAVPYETEIVASILKYLESKQIYAWRQNTSGIYVKATNSYRPSRARGVADIVGILWDGRLLAIEVKRPGAKLDNPEQIAFKENIEKNFGAYVLAYSVDDVSKAIDYYKNNPEAFSV